MDELTAEKKRLRNKAYYEANKARILAKKAKTPPSAEKPIVRQRRTSEPVLTISGRILPLKFVRIKR
jgi:hypothetical protein